MIDVGLRHLRAFSVVADLGGLAAAGRFLQRSTSSISRSIALVERACGARLLSRGSPRFYPTPEGQLVMARCHRIMAELEGCRSLLLRSLRVSVRRNAAFFDMITDPAHLRALTTVQDMGSIQRAAVMLGVSQPAVSYSILLLEADIGAELFSRMHSGMMVTPVGATVATTARRVLAEIVRLSDDLRSVDGSSVGVVRVGGLAYSRSAILPEAIRQTLAENPRIVIRTVEGPIESLLAALHGDQIDVVICAHPDRAFLDGVTVEPVTLDEMALFVSRSHPLAGRKGLELKDVAAFPFILPPAGSITRSHLERAFHDAGVSMPVGRAETSSFAIIRNLLLGGEMVAFRSRREFSVHDLDQHIAELDLASALPNRTICILLRRNLHQTQALTKFLSVVRQLSLA